MHIEITTKTQMPDWSDTPEWVKFRAVDPDGAVLWFEEEPEIDVDGWIAHRGRFELPRARPKFDGWSASMEGRPDAI